MICNYSSVLFVYTLFIFCCYIGFSTNLKTLLALRYVIIKCSNYEYLFIDDWFKFESLNISCPNQTERFENQLSYIYNYTVEHSDCNEKTKSISVNFYAMIPSLQMHENDNFTDEQLTLLSTTTIVNETQYSFEATRTKSPNKVLVNNVSIQWASNNIYLLYTIFKEQPIACRFRLNNSELVENGICGNGKVYYYPLCYYEPLSKSPLKKIPWAQLMDFIYTDNYLPSNWQGKGGIYYDIRLHKTTTTLQSTSKKIKATTSTVHKISKSTTKKFQKIKSNSIASKKSTSKKSSSSPSMLLILLLIFFLCGTIGLVLFFIYRFRQNRQHNNQSLLDRVGSVESNNSEMNESEISENRRGGRVMNQLDPDAL